MSSSTVITKPDPIMWYAQGDYLYMTVLAMDVGFYKPYGCFALRPDPVRTWLAEPAIYMAARPWFRTAAGWDYFTAAWATETIDYAGPNSEPWNTVSRFGWSHEFNVRDPPAGPDCQLRAEIELLSNHRSFQSHVSVTPYVALENIGLEHVFFIRQEYISAISQVQIERTSGVPLFFPIQQARDIKQEVPDAVEKIGLIYHTPELEEYLLCVYSAEEYNWDHVVIATEQMSIQGTPYWVIRIGGTNLVTPRPVAAMEEVIF